MKWFRMLGLLLALPVYQKAQAQTATVTWTTTHQTIDGFGGQTWVYADSLTTAQAQVFFSPSSGIGLQYIRTANTYNGSIPDLTTLQNAGAQGALIELGLQSPPCTLKHSHVELGEACTDPGASSGAFYDGSASSNGTCLTSSQSLATSYAAWATYIVNYVNTLASSVGYPIAVVDVQNEPDPNPNNSSLGACILPASGFDVFIGTYLGPAFASASWNSTQRIPPKIMMASQADTFPFHDWVSTCLNDPTCAQYVSIVSGHSLDNAVSAFPSVSYDSGRHVWASEIDPHSTTPYDASMTNAIGVAQNIHNYLANENVSGYEYWQLAYAQPYNFGLTDSTFAPSKRFYVVGNWSKFVRPGWVRIDATANPANEVYITAFKETISGSFTIVAVNKNSDPVNVEFTLAGFPSVTSVTPTLTSASANLVDQASENVSGDAFTFLLPATSVVTFRGTTSSSTAKVPAPPTSLTVSVH
jgi:glucuronoarabinoxylan endo-1,4-beta-xylanase